MQIKTGVVEIIILMISIFETLLTAFVASVFFFWPRKYKNISGDVILITGGGKGIGRLIAVEFTKRKPKQVFSNIKYKTSMTDIDSFVFCMKHTSFLRCPTDIVCSKCRLCWQGSIPIHWQLFPADSYRLTLGSWNEMAFAGMVYWHFFGRLEIILPLLSGRLPYRYENHYNCCI